MWCPNLCYMSVWIYGLRKKIKERAQYSLTAHRTPIVTFFNGTWQVNIRLYADQYLLFAELTCLSTEVKPSFIAKKMSMGSVSWAYTTWRYQFKKLSLASQHVSLSLGTTAVLQWCICYSLFAFYVDDAYTLLYCINHTKDFLGIISNQAPISFNFSSVHVLYMFFYCAKLNLLLKTHTFIAEFFSCVELVHSEIFFNTYDCASCSHCVGTCIK